EGVFCRNIKSAAIRGRARTRHRVRAGQSLALEDGGLAWSAFTAHVPTREVGSRSEGQCVGRCSRRESAFAHVPAVGRGRTYRGEPPAVLYPARFRPRVLRAL